jgi:DNA-binding protein
MRSTHIQCMSALQALNSTLVGLATKNVALCAQTVDMQRRATARVCLINIVVAHDAVAAVRVHG